MHFNKIFLLDGGMGQELTHRSPKPPDNLWSTRVLLDEYNLVVDLHKDFIKAGADGITLNSYCITPHRLKRHNLENMFLTLQQKAIAAAKQAVNEISIDRQVKILGCLPPLIASYHRTVGINRKEAIELYKKMIDIQEKHVDIFICETVSSIEEAEIVTTAALDTGKKVWLSFTIDEDDGSLLRSGEQLKLALQEFDNSKIDAFLLNCSPPEAIYKAINISIIAKALAATGKRAEAHNAAKLYVSKNPNSMLPDFIPLFFARRMLGTDPQKAANLAQALTIKHRHPVIGGAAESLLDTLVTEHNLTMKPLSAYEQRRRATSLRQSNRQREAWTLFQKIQNEDKACKI